MDHNRNDGHNPRLQVHIQPNIGLDSDVRHSVVELLNITLADEAVLITKPAVPIGMFAARISSNCTPFMQPNLNC